MLSRYLRLYGKFVLWQLWQVGRRRQGGPCGRSRLWSRRLRRSRLTLTACHSRVAWHVHQREFTRHYLQSWQNQPESESVYTAARFIQQRQESLMSRMDGHLLVLPVPVRERLCVRVHHRHPGLAQLANRGRVTHGPAAVKASYQ